VSTSSQARKGRLRSAKLFQPVALSGFLSTLRRTQRWWAKMQARFACLDVAQGQGKGHRFLSTSDPKASLPPLLWRFPTFFRKWQFRWCRCRSPNQAKPSLHPKSLWSNEPHLAGIYRNFWQPPMRQDGLRECAGWPENSTATLIPTVLRRREIAPAWRKVVMKVKPYLADGNDWRVSG